MLTQFPIVTLQATQMGPLLKVLLQTTKNELIMTIMWT